MRQVALALLLATCCVSASAQPMPSSPPRAVALYWSASVRVFEAAAVGTPIISDEWPSLGDLVPNGSAILTADASRQVADYLEQVPSARRNAIGAAARRIVLARHTGLARARELATALNPAPARAVSKIKETV